jgi:hypothetical protein
MSVIAKKKLWNFLVLNFSIARMILFRAGRARLGRGG